MTPPFPVRVPIPTQVTIPTQVRYLQVEPFPDLRGWTPGRQLPGRPRIPGMSRPEADLEERADAGDELE